MVDSPEYIDRVADGRSVERRVPRLLEHTKRLLCTK